MNPLHGQDSLPTSLWVDYLIRAGVVWLLIAVTEVVHGALRVKMLNRRVGDKRARQIAVFTGSGLIILIAFITLPWIAATTVQECLATGLLWIVLMFGLEIYFGRFVFRVPWKRIFADFDFRRGGLLSIGFLVLFLAPLISAKLHGVL